METTTISRQDFSPHNTGQSLAQRLGTLNVGIAIMPPAQTPGEQIREAIAHQDELNKSIDAILQAKQIRWQDSRLDGRAI